MSLLDSTNRSDPVGSTTMSPASVGFATYRVNAMPTTHALGRIVAALHARNIEVQRLTWSTEPTVASGRSGAVVVIDVALDDTRIGQLGAVLNRLVDVTTVELSFPELVGVSREGEGHSSISTNPEAPMGS